MVYGKFVNGYLIRNAEIIIADKNIEYKQNSFILYIFYIKKSRKMLKKNRIKGEGIENV